MSDRRGRAGRPWERIKAAIQAETTNCWRCGKAISGEYRWPHPLSVTVGHIIAREDCIAMGIDVEDPSNLAGECIACNMSDGARRTNSKRQGNTNTERISYKNPRW